MSLALLALALATVGLLTSRATVRTRILLGALGVGLASASLHAVAGGDGPGAFTGVDLDANGLAFLQAVSGLLILGFAAAWSAGGGLPLAVVTVAAAVAGRPLFLAAGLLRPVGIAAGLLALLVFGWLVVARLRPGRLLVAIDRGLLDPRGRSGWRTTDAWAVTPPLLAAGAATLGALLVPHLWTVLGGAVIATVAAWLAFRQAHRAAWLLWPAAVLIAVTLLWSVRLAGPLGGWIPSLVDGPFSPRAAQGLALMVGGAGLVLAGAWPLHGLTVPVLLGPIVVAVAGVFATLLIPDGVQWLQPLAAPLALVAMLHALAWRRVDQFLAMAGLYGLWTGTRAGALGGALLIGTAWCLAVAPTTWIGRVPVPPAGRRLAWLIPIVGALAVQRGAIATETVYAVLATLVAAAGVVGFSTSRPSAVVAPPR